MTKKVLFVSHTANFSKFNRPFMRWFKQQGWRVEYASAGEEEVKDCDQHHQISFQRSPFSMDNLRAYRQLKAIIDQNNYDLIHCHTPVGGIVARQAAKQARRRGTKVIYTAHGFHFYDGAPLSYWLFYYPIEKYYASAADAVVTINSEDYQRAKAKFKTQVYKIDGVGVNLDKFKSPTTEEKAGLRKQHGYTSDDIIMIYVAELNQNKNQRFLIESLDSLPDNFQLILCGTGVLEHELKDLVKQLKLEKQVKFTGYIKNTEDFYALADICVASSIREGLGLNLLEAMASGLPVVASANRGHRDLTVDGENGFMYLLGDQEKFIEQVQKIADDDNLRDKLAENCLQLVDKYSVERAVKQMAKIYLEVLDERK